MRIATPKSNRRSVHLGKPLSKVAKPFHKVNSPQDENQSIRCSKRASRPSVKKPQHMRRGSFGVPSTAKHYHKKHLSFDLENFALKFAFRSCRGYIPGPSPKPNQDSHFQCINITPGVSLFGVCDGHGPEGHTISSFVSSRLPNLFLKHISKGISRALHTSILECSEEVKQLDSDFSGTTLVAVCIKGRDLWCANVGDSRAVLGRKLEGQKQWMAIALSRDHKPDLSQEAVRIRNAGGRIAAFIDEDGEPVGPPRVWLFNDDVPGLAMSRSLGDNVAASVGVLAEPEIIEFKLTPADKFVVIASDGVFEFINNEDVVRMAIVPFKMGDLEAAAETIEREALRRWRAEEDVIDDITSVVVSLGYV